MKYLKVERDRGFFWKKLDDTSSDWAEIDTITKEDLLALLNKAIDEDDYEMDQYEETKMANKAHQIIYRNIYNKLSELLKSRDQFRDESQQMYRDAILKYSS